MYVTIPLSNKPKYLIRNCTQGKSHTCFDMLNCRLYHGHFPHHTSFYYRSKHNHVLKHLLCSQSIVAAHIAVKVELKAVRSRRPLVVLYRILRSKMLTPVIPIRMDSTYPVKMEIHKRKWFVFSSRADLVLGRALQCTHFKSPNSISMFLSIVTDQWFLIIF